MKVQVRVENRLRYDSDVIIELPSYMSGDEFDSQLDEVENALGGHSNSTFQDVVRELEKRGFDVRETITGFPDSPSDTYTEITDFTIVKDEDD